MRALWFVAALAIAVSLAPAARAHAQARSYCTVRTVVGGLDVTIESAAHLLAQPLGLGSGAIDDRALLEARERLAQQLVDRVQAHTPAGRCRVEAGLPALETRDEDRVVRTELRFFCPAGPVTLRNTWRHDVDPGSETVCAVDGAAWVFRPGIEELPLGAPPTLAAVLRSFVALGAAHVLAGIDHVLFVVVLLVAAALGSAERDMKRGLSAVAGVVTGFTLGHSVTLILAGLGVLRLDPRVTESVIALSIVAVGLENVLSREIRWRFWTASAFGLVHGFGFASVLADTELPRRATVWALVAFNVGIELAQLGIVLLTFPLLALAARRPWYRPWLMRPVSAAVAFLAGLWFVKRAAAVEFLPWLGS